MIYKLVYCSGMGMLRRYLKYFGGIRLDLKVHCEVSDNW